MSLKDIAKLSNLLGQFLARFADCFVRPAGRALLLVHVRGLLSDVQRKNMEGSLKRPPISNLGYPRKFPLH